MKALSEAEVNQICDLYKTYDNLRDVSKLSARSVGIVHKHLSLHSLIKKRNIVKEICTNDERLIGVYVGLWMGDGTQYKDRYNYTIKICTNRDDVNLNKFVQCILFDIFNTKSRLFTDKKKKSAYIKFNSKFIFEFISKYAIHDKRMKTYSIGLKKRTNSYSKEFREGCLLGLALSDGYLKNNFVFTVSSSRLARNMYDLLVGFRYKPHSFLDNRVKYHNNIMYSVKLTKADSIRLRMLFNKIIRDLGFDYSFQELKYGPAQI